MPVCAILLLYLYLFRTPLRLAVAVDFSVSPRPLLYASSACLQVKKSGGLVHELKDENDAKLGNSVNTESSRYLLTLDQNVLHF